MRFAAIPLLIVAGLLVIAVLLPGKRDTSLRAWWLNVRVRADLFARVALVVAVVLALIRYVVLPAVGWQIPVF